MENLVESVEFNPVNRLECLSFELSPQSFQLVEKLQSVYGMYRRFLWKTFDLGKTAELHPADRAAGKTFLQLPKPAGRNAFYRKNFSAGQ